MKDRANLIGFLTSLTLHVAVLLSFLISFKDSMRSPEQQQTITISMMKIKPTVAAIPEPKPVVEKVVKEKIVKKVVEKKIEPKKEEPEPEKTPEKKSEKAEKDLQTVDSPNPSEIDNTTTNNTVTAGGGEFDVGALIKEIVSKYAKNHYPTNAKKLRQTGSVTVMFKYSGNGLIENLIVVTSSGFKLLDEAAMAAIEKTKAKFPKIEAINNYKVKIEYSLKN